jgi:hypothetical protein
MKINGINFTFVTVCIFVCLISAIRIESLLSVNMYVAIFLGLLLGGVVYYVIAICLGFLLEVFFPVWPKCKCGKRVKTQFSNGVYRIVNCKCGITYINKGNLFAEISRDGQQISYMAQDENRRWIPSSNVGATPGSTPEIDAWLREYWVTRNR